MRTSVICAAMLLAVATSAFAQTETPAPAPSEAAAAAPAAEAPSPAPEAASPTAPVQALPAGISAPPEGKGQIVFFRPSRFVGGALTFTVRESEADLGRLPNGRYFVHVAEPGVHEYEIGRQDTLRLEIEPGTTYFVIQTTQMGVMAGRSGMSPSDQAAFEEALPRMRVSEPRS